MESHKKDLKYDEFFRDRKAIGDEEGLEAKEDLDGEIRGEGTLPNKLATMNNVEVLQRRYDPIF